MRDFINKMMRIVTETRFRHHDETEQIAGIRVKHGQHTQLPQLLLTEGA
ncbi:hypothetical protein [Oceanisphaera pacifica]|uniref:Uncharacterized protein n=1 Tax=Oceanisphaera pacifica TaxID=2818389 RepID=A0ABS3NDT9_9GAMM|nr:hypothetical protein [Oceanisphaera pacifica]MBO1518652.1 hypothetical protein [Oceanisphaera pacifica]